MAGVELTPLAADMKCRSISRFLFLALIVVIVVLQAAGSAQSPEHCGLVALRPKPAVVGLGALALRSKTTAVG